MRRLIKKINKLSIQQKVVISLNILIILPMIVSGYFSYSSSSRIINKKTSEHFYQVMSQTSENYRTIFNEVENISYIILANESTRNLLNSNEVDSNYMKAYNQVNLLVGTFLAKPYVYSVTISKGNNVVYQFGASVSSVDRNLWYKEAENKKGKVEWSSLYEMEYQINKPAKKVISLYRQIIDIDQNVPIGMLRISISEDMLFDIQKNLVDRNNSNFFLIDEDGIILSNNDKRNLGKVIKDNERIYKLTNEEVFYSGRISNGEYAYIHKVQGYNYYIVGIILSSDIFYETKPIRNIILFSLIGCFLFCICFIYIMYISITKPIRVLISKMNEVEDGNFDVHISNSSENEIGGLFYHFNSMVSKIKLLIKNLYEVKLKEREAELKALQEQINPHFLYNTLDTIRWTARKNHDLEVSEYIEILSNILRHNLNNGYWETTIGQETAHLNDYIYLQKKRYGEKLQVNVNIDERLFNYKIVKLVLQPIVENSITHAFNTNQDIGTIIVEGEKIGDSIVLQISDNGAGSEENEIRQIISSKSETKKIYALKNIDERIKLHYGDEYGIDFSSKINKGTKVRITIPAIKYDDRCL